MKQWQILGALTASAIAGCAARPLTEVVVVVHTDLAVPTQIDGLSLDALGPSGELERSIGAWRDASEPRTVGLVHDGGALGPVQVWVTGTRAGLPVVQSRAVFSFVQGEVRTLEMWLLGSCVGGCADATLTCSLGGCRSEQIAPEELTPWRGTVPLVDAGLVLVDTGPGATDAGVPLDAWSLDAPLPDAPFDGGRSDGGASDGGPAAPDAATCCPATAPRVMTFACVSDTCVTTCEPGFGNCDLDATTGCETSVTSTRRCGSCSIECLPGQRCREVAGGSGYACM